MAQEIADSKLIDTWSSSGLIVKPDVSKIIEGWQFGEQPPHEYMNWLQNTFGSKLNHILKNGVASWNNETEYLAGASVQHNGNVWLCKATNTNSEPTDVNANWEKVAINKDLTLTVDTVDDLRSISYPANTVWASGYHSKNDGAFGSHIFRLKGVKTTETDNGGTVIIATIGTIDYVYELQYDGAVNVEWFGAKGGGRSSDDTIAINKAIEAAEYEVYFPTDVYLSTYLDISTRITPLELNLNGSTISQGVQYARLTATATINRTLGATTTFQVEDSSLVSVGTSIRSSYGLGSNVNVGGPIVISKTATSITVQYDTSHGNFDNGTASLPIGAYVGNFGWSQFAGSNTVKVIIKNGELTETKGYFFANASAEIYSENVNFTMRGLDGFNLKRPTGLYSFKNCKFIGSMDVAKQTFVITNGGDLKFSGCTFNSSNFDSEISYWGNEEGYEDAESTLSIDNCIANGTNSTITGEAAYSSNTLHFISVTCDMGIVRLSDINIRNSHISKYLRGTIGTTVRDANNYINIYKASIDGCRIDNPLGGFKTLTNGMDTTSFTISDTMFYLESDNIISFLYNEIDSSVSNLDMKFNNCSFRFLSTGHGTFPNSTLSSCKFDNCRLVTTDSSRTILNSISLRGVNSGVSIFPTYAARFVGGMDGLITIDNTNFPLAINSIISSTYTRYAQLCSLRSVRGGAIYDVSTFDGVVSLAGTFRVPTVPIPDGSFRGDDWFVPGNSSIVVGSVTKGKTTKAWAITAFGTQATGTTSIIVNNGSWYPGSYPEIGDYINIVLTDGTVFTTTITSFTSAANAIFGIATALPSACSNLGNISVFRVVLT